MNRVRGFSMVELMVAITLALIVTTGVISVFVGSRSAYQATSGTAELTDGGRFALNFISNSLRSAGYMACTTASRVQGILNAGSPMLYSFNEALEGYEAVGTGTGAAYAVAPPPVAGDPTVTHWITSGVTPNLDPILAGLPLTNNDVLVVRSTLANAQAVYVSNIVDGTPSFNVNAQGPLAVNQLAAISDCSKAVVFQITAVGGGIVTHNAAAGAGANGAAAFPLSFSPGAQVTPIDTVVYFIGKGADGDGALFSYDLSAVSSGAAPGATELVPDIEAMQLLYGIDTSNTQTVSQYVTADLVPDFNTVMSVKVALLAASAPGSGHQLPGANTFKLLGTTVTVPVDTRARQVFEETIAVRNSLP